MKTHNAKWLLIALILIFAAMFSAAIAEGEAKIIAEGKCGANATWKYDSENTLTISGTGKMKDYEYDYGGDTSNSPWNKYRNSIKSVVIEDGITSIGNVSFMYFVSLESVTIPDSVTSIGQEAFFECRSLPSITLPDHLTSIGGIAFYGCESLPSIEIPDSVTSIGDEAFEGCKRLTSIEIPDGVTSIGSGLFYSCSGLTNISIPDSVTSIGGSAFNGCSSLPGIAIPEGVTSIGDEAFRNCSSLTSITLPEGVTSIGRETFSGCSKLTSITIPERVTSIGYWSFANCVFLTDIVLPEGVTFIDEGAFAGCKRLTSIEIPEGVTSIGEDTFYKCSALTSTTLPEGLTSIGKEAFYYCDHLTDIVLPENLTSIGKYAFGYCSALTSINIPDSVTSIGSYAFYGCDSVANVYAGSLESWLGIDFYDQYSHPMYYGAVQLYFNNELAVNITVPDGITSIGNYTFYNCSSLRSITLPKSVASIGEYAFYKCGSLAGIEVPEGAASIGKYAFYNCSSMTDIDLPDSVASIGPAAFWGCTGLTSIAIPEGVTSISASLFNGCDNLTSIIIPDGVISIGNWAFPSKFGPSGSSKIKVYLLGEEAPKFTFSNYFNKSKVTIYCHEFSEVDFWAVENGYSCVYVDPEAPESLSISLSAETEFYPGEALKLRVNTYPLSASRYPIAWKSSDDSVVAVKDGVPTAVSAGTATITASCGSLSDSITVTVLPLTTPKSLKLPEDARLLIDAALTIQAVTSPLDASEYNIVWESSNPEVATVENGVVRPVSTGTTTITASCGVKSDSMEVTVYAEMKSFELSAAELWLVSKETAQLTVENILPAGATGYTFRWKSSDISVLTVEDGAITAKVPGDAVVTATSSNGISRQCTVHVCYPVTAIEFEESRITMSMDAPKQLTASVTTRGQSLINKLVTFASSDETVAAVDKNGLVTAVKSGNTTITATAANGITANCEIIVRNPNTLTLSQGVKTIKTKAFFGVAVEEIVIPNGCRQIDAQAFANNSKLVFVYMPDSITLIADDAFDGCDSLHFVCESKNTAAEYAEKHNIPYSIED